jgi:hypothetical protein
LIGDAFEAYRNYQFILHTAVMDRERAVLAASQEQIEWVQKAYRNFRSWMEEQNKKLPMMKAQIQANCGNRSQYVKTPPEVLGKLLAITMESREKDDFQVIQYILGSTVNASESISARQSKDHKLKWTLRWVSEIRTPESRGPALENWKDAAMRDGIRILKEFGEATGKWKKLNMKRNLEFSSWLDGFLKECLQ